MSLREKHQMILDTESATHTGMEGKSSRCCHKHLLLQVWCGLLTVAMVVMAAFLSTIKLKSTEGESFTTKPDQISSTVETMVASFKSKSTRSSPSHIQLVKPNIDHQWEEENTGGCHSCSLVLREDSIHCKKESLYLIYAQVTFSVYSKTNQTKSVILKRNATTGRLMKELAVGTFPQTRAGSVWVANIVRLKKGDSVSIIITDDYLTHNTFWGAYQLH